MSLPRRVLRRLSGRRWPDFGDLSGTAPISRAFGFDRGTPVDRYYIERFLADHATAIRGRTLEVGDDSYTRRFGAAGCRREVIHVNPANAAATYHGDMSQAGILPEARFDCAVITQTLHLIYDMVATVRRLHASLSVGGTLLLTVPGITQIAADQWGATWYWSLTELSLTRLLSDAFGNANVAVRSYGNVHAATALLHGLATEEVSRDKLDVVDPLYPVIVAGAAVRR